MKDIYINIFFGLGIMVVILSSLSSVLGHRGFSSELATICFLLILVGTGIYIHKLR